MSEVMVNNTVFYLSQSSKNHDCSKRKAMNLRPSLICKKIE